MSQIKGSLYLLGAFMLAGTSVIAARFVAHQLGSFTISAVSLFIACVGLLCTCGKQLFQRISRLSVKEWLMLLSQALFGIFLFRFFLLQGLSLTSSGEAGVLTGITPAVTAILAKVILKEALSMKKAFGITVTVIGVMIVQGVLAPDKGMIPAHLWGNILVVLAAVSESLFNILSKLYSKRSEPSGKDPMNPLHQTTLVSILAFFLCLIPAMLEKPVPSLIALTIGQWMALVWYGLFVTALAFVFWYAGIKSSPASRAAAFSGMMPFTSLFLSAVVLNEPIGLHQGFGGLLIILGILMI